MPIYVFENPQTGEVKEILQAMNESHSYTDSEGQKWSRVFTSPNANFDTHVDPHSQSDYLKATANKKGTMGDLMDYSKELSDKRASMDGTDPLRDKFLSDYKKRTGKKHSSESKVYESKNVKVEYD